MMTFISLSENDKRFLFAILLVFIIVLVLIGYIGYLVTRIMKWQGKKMDTLVADPVITRVITDKHHFISYARKKNWRLFFKQSYIGILILLFGVIMLLIRDGVYKDFSYNPFNTKDGFGSLIFVWDYSVCFKREGASLIVQWPKLINTPHFEIKAWGGYLFAISLFVGGAWYLVALQSLIARTFRMYSLSNTAFEKTLNGFNQNVTYNPNNINTNNENQQ